LNNNIAELGKEYTDLTYKLARECEAHNQISIRERGLIKIDPKFDCANISEIESRIDFIDGAIQEMTEHKAHILANQRYENLLDDLTREKAESEQKLDILKAWVKVTDTNGLQTRLADAPFKALGNLMNKTLSAIYGSDTYSVFNTSEGANKFNFGMVKNGGSYVRYSSLSSGEKCVFTLALLIALTEYNDSDFKIILIDDFFDHLDDQAVERCFKTLSEITDIQILVAGVKQSQLAADHTIFIGAES
jgi:DNA repair exonuclease SbcCD ATPase subunit